MPAKKVLITGAAGGIGSYLVHNLPAVQYDLVLADIRQPDYEPSQPFIELDIANLDQFTAACEGVDTVVHLAADPRTTAPWESLLPANVIGVYNAFEAARRAGCKRVIYASSINASSGYPVDVQIRTDMPTHPGNLYGATKVWGEAVAQVYADHHNVSCLCLRFGWVGSRDDADKLTTQRALSIYITFEDIQRLIMACIDAPDDLKFGIFHGLSDNLYKRMDLTDTCAILGYEPQDDAFELSKQFSD